MRRSDARCLPAPPRRGAQRVLGLRFDSRYGSTRHVCAIPVIGRRHHANHFCSGAHSFNQVCSQRQQRLELCAFSFCDETAVTRVGVIVDVALRHSFHAAAVELVGVRDLAELVIPPRDLQRILPFLNFCSHCRGDPRICDVQVDADRRDGLAVRLRASVPIQRAHEPAENVQVECDSAAHVPIIARQRRKRNVTISTLPCRARATRVAQPCCRV